MPTAFSNRQAVLHTFAETMPNIQPCSRPQLSISGLSSCFKGLYYLAEIHVTQPGWCHKANNAAISSGERCCMHSANRIAFNSPCNSEEEELSPLHLRLCLPPAPPSAKRCRSHFIPTRMRRWLLRGGLVAELLCFRRRCLFVFV